MSSIPGKVLEGLEKSSMALGGAYGYLGVFNDFSKSYMGGNLVNGLIEEHMRIFTNGHLPTVSELPVEIGNHYPLIGGEIGMTVGGWILSKIDGVPHLARAARAAMKFGIGGLIGTVGASVLLVSIHSDPGPSPSFRNMANPGSVVLRESAGGVYS